MATSSVRCATLHRAKLCPQFSLRALLLITVAAAVVLAAFVRSGPAGGVFAGVLAGLVSLLAGGLIGALDYGRTCRGVGMWRGPAATGAVGGAIGGLMYALLGLWGAWLGRDQLCWPYGGMFLPYYWSATGAMVGGAMGLFAMRFLKARPQAPAATTAPGALRWFEQFSTHSPCWLASAHLHVMAATALSFAAVGLHGRLSAGGHRASEHCEIQSLAGWANIEPVTLGPEMADREEVSFCYFYCEPPEVRHDPPTIEPPDEGLLAASPALQRPGMRCLVGGRDRYELRSLPELHARPSVRQDLDVAPGSFVGTKGNPGVTLTLWADKRVIRPGEQVTFHTTIRNMLDEPLNFYVGYSNGGVYFESGMAVRGFSDKPGERLHPGSLARFFCGTGEGPLYVAIPPGGVVTYRMPATFDAKPDPNNPWRQPPAGAYMFQRYYYLQPPAGNVHRFAVTLSATETNHQNGARSHGGMRGADPKARNWVGEVFSNEVTLRVDR